MFVRVSSGGFRGELKRVGHWGRRLQARRRAEHQRFRKAWPKGSYAKRKVRVYRLSCWDGHYKWKTEPWGTGIDWRPGGTLWDNETVQIRWQVGKIDAHSHTSCKLRLDYRRGGDSDWLEPRELTRATRDEYNKRRELGDYGSLGDYW